MLLIRLAVKNAFRHRLRSVLTILGVAVAILAFGLLRTLVDAWYSGVEASAADRLVTRNAISLTFSLPLAYREKIRSVPGVTQVSQGNWFGGIYVDEKNFFANLAYDLPSLLAVYPELAVTDQDQLNALLHDRKGALVGAKLAARFGWKVGDQVTLRGTIFAGDWDFTIRAIYKATRAGVDENQFFFHWTYLDETLRSRMPTRAGNVGLYLVGIDDPTRSADISKAIDAMFANSLAETLTETEKAFQMGFVSMSSAIILAIKLVSFVVVLIILAVSANTMTMSARERSGEYAVLKTMGFGSSTLAMLIMGEALALSVSGALLGLGLVLPCAKAVGTFMTDFFPVFLVSDQTIWLGLAAGVAVGLLSGVYPAVYAARVGIAQALRKVG